MLGPVGGAHAPLVWTVGPVYIHTYTFPPRRETCILTSLSHPLSTQALEEELGLPLNSTELPPLPPTHLPAFEWLIQLLSIPQDTALRYADALRGGLAVHTGEELLGKRYEEVEPVLVDVGILQGHRKAVKVLLKQQQRK